MATHSSILAWEIPWTEEAGGLSSMGSQSQTWQQLKACHSFPFKEQVSFNFMAAVSITVIFEPRKIKSVTVSTFSPSVCHECDGTGCYDLCSLNVEFKPAFSLSSFTLFKRLFSFSSLYAIRVVSSAYLRLLIFVPAILIPACDSSSLAFRGMVLGLP